FNLIELLVAISAIAILAASLFPAFVNVRQQARMLTSADDARQIGLGLGLYAQDWDETLPFQLSPSLDSYLSPGLTDRIRRSETARHFPEDRFDLTPPPDVVPYYVYSVLPGVPGHLETWDYRLASGLGADPLRYLGRNYVDRGLLLNPCLS